MKGAGLSVLCLLWTSCVFGVRLADNVPCLRFLGLGDWGTPSVARTAKSMAQQVHVTSPLCSSIPESVLMLGDNFYDSGIRTIYDPLFTEYFTNNFAVPAFAGISFSVIAGNHDHRGMVQDQVQLSGRSESHQWYFPSLYYSRVFERDGLRILISFLDTWELVGGEAEILGKDQIIVDYVQLRWLRETLMQEGFDYKIVIGHYPIRSGRHDTPGLVKDLLPLLQEANVDVYINGHDHFSQVIKRDGLVYVGSGNGGGRGTQGVIKTAPGLVWASSHPLGYFAVIANKNTLLFDFYEISDRMTKVAYSFEIPSKSSTTNGAENALLAQKIKSHLLADW